VVDVAGELLPLAASGKGRSQVTAAIQERSVRSPLRSAPSLAHTESPPPRGPGVKRGVGGGRGLTAGSTVVHLDGRGTGHGGTERVRSSSGVRAGVWFAPGLSAAGAGARARRRLRRRAQESGSTGGGFRLNQHHARGVQRCVGKGVEGHPDVPSPPAAPRSSREGGGLISEGGSPRARLLRCHERRLRHSARLFVSEVNAAGRPPSEPGPGLYSGPLCKARAQRGPRRGWPRAGSDRAPYRTAKMQAT
jgi:hypothetical protein